MLVPTSWLKDFVDIKLSLKDLSWRLTEVGLSVEKITKTQDDSIIELEITPNRPDCLSILGIAREVAAIESRSIKYKEYSIKKPKTKKWKIKIINDFQLCPRYTGIIISGITIKPSPILVQERLKKVGLRPINNVVDLSNYIMWELGNPVHCFDYDTIIDKTMHLQKSLGGEEFVSVDGLSYKLPKDAIIIKDRNRVIDLCGLKGGSNTGISSKTKNIFIHIPVYDPVSIRRTSQVLGLRSDASAIFERGVNRGGTVEALIKLANLIIKSSGGEIASEIIDLKKEKFEPWIIKLSLKRQTKILGKEIPKEKVVIILESLNLKTKIINEDLIKVEIPTYRNDLKLEEDLIEEIARHYSYNKFPLTLPKGETPVKTVAYAKDYKPEEKIKNLMVGVGFSEVYTYGLISHSQIKNLGLNPLTVIKIANPVSLDFEYLRPTVIGNLLEAIKLNQPNFSDIKIFELGKVYQNQSASPVTRRYRASGRINKQVNSEDLHLTAVATGEKFYELKGISEKLLEILNIKDFSFNPIKEKETGIWHPFRALVAEVGTKALEFRTIGIVGEINPLALERFQIKGRVTAIDLNLTILEKLIGQVRLFKPLSLYPAIIEDLTFIFPEKVTVGKVIWEIYKTSLLVNRVDFLGAFGNAKTFRIHYQSQESNLTEKEVREVREKILKKLKEKFNLNLKGK